MKSKCECSVLCNDGANFYRGEWYDCEKRKWGYVITDKNGNKHDFTFASFCKHFSWKQNPHFIEMRVKIMCDFDCIYYGCCEKETE